jgi:DNA-binding MarR family transcriptional regulator
MSAEGHFHDVVHAPIRLRACALLGSVDELEFSVLRDTLGISDATLSKHMRVLADAGLVKLRKRASASRADARRLTWIALTRQGRLVVAEHLRALRELQASFDPTLT